MSIIEDIGIEKSSTSSTSFTSISKKEALRRFNKQNDLNNANLLKRIDEANNVCPPCCGAVRYGDNISFSCNKTIKIISVLILFVSILIGFAMYKLNSFKRIQPVKYMDFEDSPSRPAHKWLYEKEFFQKESGDFFTNLALSGETFSTVVEESSVESAGEQVPIGHVHCKHPFMTLNLNRTMCHFSNRLDVGMHFVLTGGFNGYIEYYDRMVARIIPFRRRLIQQQKKNSASYNLFFNLNKIKELQNETFLNKIKSICIDNQIFQKKSSLRLDSIRTEIFQLDILLMLPGQELPMHLNVPYFWGADRNTLPQWLLVLMKSSQLFENYYVPQVRGFSWINTDESFNKPHEEINEHEFIDIYGEGGDFYFYPYKTGKKNKQEAEKKKNSNDYVILKRNYNSAVFLDGAQVTHGVDRYRPNDLPPLFGANHHYTIRYDKKTNQWNLNDFQNNLLTSYRRDDVKLMVVWNMHCFASESEQKKFHTDQSSNQMKLETIMQTFKQDLKKRNKLPFEDIEPIDLWTIAIKEYLKYPVNTHNQNSTLFGINYCLLPNVMPKWFTKNILDRFLNLKC